MSPSPSSRSSPGFFFATSLAMGVVTDKEVVSGGRGGSLQINVCTLLFLRLKKRPAGIMLSNHIFFEFTVGFLGRVFLSSLLLHLRPKASCPRSTNLEPMTRIRPLLSALRCTCAQALQANRCLWFSFFDFPLFWKGSCSRALLF